MSPQRPQTQLKVIRPRVHLGKNLSSKSSAPETPCEKKFFAPGITIFQQPLCISLTKTVVKVVVVVNQSSGNTYRLVVVLEMIRMRYVWLWSHARVFGSLTNKLYWGDLIYYTILSDHYDYLMFVVGASTFSQWERNPWALFTYHFWIYFRSWAKLLMERKFASLVFLERPQSTSKSSSFYGNTCGYIFQIYHARSSS